MMDEKLIDENVFVEKNDFTNLIPFITDKNEFIVRLKEFHKQFKNLGLIFDIDSYKDLFKMLRMVDWTDYDMFRGVFQFIFIKDRELIDIFNKIFSTIFKYGDFLENFNGLATSDEELENLIQKLPEYFDINAKTIKNKKSSKLSSTKSTSKSNKKRSNSKKEFKGTGNKKTKLFSQIERLLKYDIGSLNSIFRQYYTRSDPKVIQNNSQNDQDSKDKNNNMKKDSNNKLKTSNKKKSQQPNILDLAFKLKHYNEFFNQYKNNLQDLNASLQSYKNIGYDLKETYKQFVPPASLQIAVRVKPEISNNPSEIFNSLFLKKSKDKNLSDKEIFDRWFYLSRENLKHANTFQDIYKKFDEFDKIFLKSSPQEFLEICGKYIKLKNLTNNNAQNVLNLDVFSEFINKTVNKSGNKTVNNDMINNTPTSKKNPLSSPSRKSYQGSPKSGVGLHKNKEENQNFYIDISSFKTFSQNSGESSLNNCFDGIFSEITEKIQNTLRKLVENNADYLIFHDSLTRAYFLSSVFPKLEDFLEKNAELLRKTDEKLGLNKQTAINSSIRNYINSKKSKKNKPNDIKELESIAYKLGNKLASKEGSRYLRNKRGIVNFRALFRKNIRNFDIPISLTFKKRKITKPKLVLLCDVSYSMDAYMRFYLKFFYCLERCFSNIETFAFIDSPINVLPYFKRLPFDQAFDDFMKLDVMDQWRKSDFGKAFSEFQQKFGSKIDSRTVFIVAGDARSNYRDGKTSIFYKLSKKAYRTIWLNPENNDTWDNGDSMISYYKPACDYLFKCSDPEDLLQITKANIFQLENTQKRQIYRPQFSQKYKPYRPRPRYHRRRSYYNPNYFNEFNDYDDYFGDDDFYY